MGSDVISGGTRGFMLSQNAFFINQVLNIVPTNKP